MKARPGWTVLNRGVNGERADEIRARFARDVEAAKPKVVIILAGVNDAYQGRPVEDTAADLLWMYRRAKALGIAPVAARRASARYWRMCRGSAPRSGAT